MRSCGALQRRNTDNYATVKGLHAGRSEQPGIRIVGNISKTLISSRTHSRIFRVNSPVNDDRIDLETGRGHVVGRNRIDCATCEPRNYELKLRIKCRLFEG